MRPATSISELSHFFEYSSPSLQVLEDDLVELGFGEYLVNKAAITREELFRALQLQDQQPSALLGECLATVGAIGQSRVEEHLAAWNRLGVVEA